MQTLNLTQLKGSVVIVQKVIKMKFKFITVALAAMCFNASTLAESTIISSGKEKNQLIELYTSEGCSSCPPADAWISKLKNDPRLWKDVIPVAFHVDYWDRLGWKDELASSDYSFRQHLYRQEGGISQVYTPGFVVDGKEWRGFFRRKNLDDLQVFEVGQLSAEIEDQKISIQFDPLVGIDENLIVHCAVLGFDITNEIGAGENRGRTLTHDFAVLGHNAEVVSLKNGSFNLVTQLPKQSLPAERKALVIWVSETDNQSPLQVAGDWL